MSTRALRKLQGGLEDPALPKTSPEEQVEDDDDDGTEENHEVLPSKSQNRFDLLLQGSPSESEVKEDDDMSDEGDYRGGGDDGGERDGASPQPPHHTGARKKRKKKKKRGRAKVPASSEDPTDNDKDDIDNIIKEVNAISSDTHTQVNVEKPPNDKTTRNLLNVEHKHLNPQNEMKRIFGSRVVQTSENNRRRGRSGAGGSSSSSSRSSTRSTWIIQSPPIQHRRPGISMAVVVAAEAMEGSSSSNPGQTFKFVHSVAYQQSQFKFLEAVESLNPENIMMLLNQEPFHVDTLLQVAEIFRLGDDSSMAAQLIERALLILESHSHPMFNVASGSCRLQYRQQENRSFFIALFRHILNVGQKGCYRTALELCKLLLNLSPDDDPLAVSLMIDFYALRAQEYSWLVALYDQYEPSKNLSMLPSFAFSVPLALFHLSTEGEQRQGTKDKRELSKALALAEELGSREDIRQRADNMLQCALILFPGVLMPLLDKCSIQPDAEVAAHKFFGPSAQLDQSKGLSQIVKLYVGRCFHVWKEAGVMSWMEENVKVVLSRVNNLDPLVKEGEEMRRVRYQGTPMAIYRHILMSEIKDATAALPPALANTPVMSYDPLPPPDSVCGYSRPTSDTRRTSHSSNILASFFRSLMPNYDPNAPDEPLEEEVMRAVGGQAPVGVAAGAAAGGGGAVVAAAEGEDEGQGEVRGAGDLRASVNSLLDAMRDLLSNLHLPEPPGNEADMSEEENNEWD
ncbi:hypothetical protein Pcinc_030768 [Petrolisthes cinctipes]|uniref:Transcription factor 25 n=1 Tax=Petrolisthes cinctipes TaxID=88211 RepID=A0AAE1EY22_PETCI|nr:hypothetical protein Pcinc_030768 [Petrolisthes cinctipes]